MPSKIIRDGDYLIDSFNGAPISKITSDDDSDKRFAVIVKCGHCGDGYFIPIMFTIMCKDVETAIERVKANPRVKRDKPNVVLGTFELTQHEQFFIQAINDHDPYLKGFQGKHDDQIRERRVYDELSRKYMESRFYDKRRDDVAIKTAEDYHPYYVLERFFAPRFNGERLLHQRKVVKDELLREFFMQNCIRHGIKKGEPFFLALYYQQYGKNNDLGVEYYNGYFTFEVDGKKRTLIIAEDQMKFMDEKVQEEKEIERLKKQEKERFSSGQRKPSHSQIDRFKNKWQRYIGSDGNVKPFKEDSNKQDESEESTGGIEPGSEC